MNPETFGQAVAATVVIVMVGLVAFRVVHRRRTRRQLLARLDRITHW